MINLSTYLELIVDPTYEEFKRDPTPRRAFLMCVAIYHAIDRVAWQRKTSVATLRQEWRTKLEFQLVDIVAHHFKHVKSKQEMNRRGRPGLPIGHALGLGENGDEMGLNHLHGLWFVIRDAVKFVHDQV